MKFNIWDWVIKAGIALMVITLVRANMAIHQQSESTRIREQLEQQTVLLREMRERESKPLVICQRSQASVLGVVKTTSEAGCNE